MRPGAASEARATGEGISRRAGNGRVVNVKEDLARSTNGIRRTSVVAAGLMLVAGGMLGTASAQGVGGENRTRSFAPPDRPLTRQLVVKALAVVPDSGNADVPSEASLSTRIEFAFDSAALTPAARRDLDVVASALNGLELTAVRRLTVEGHTDARGDADYNMRLSRRRADAVVTYLMQRGVAANRLQPAGFGEYRPLPEYPAEDGRQRRVEFVRAF